jgi:hypothetical protein
LEARLHLLETHLIELNFSELACSNIRRINGA